jgi:hypothetical protein
VEAGLLLFSFRREINRNDDCAGDARLVESRLRGLFLFWIAHAVVAGEIGKASRRARRYRVGSSLSLVSSGTSVGLSKWR